MRAITLYQPYASAVAYGLKEYETRSWSTNYRGRIAIQAGKSKEALEYVPNLIPAQLGEDSFNDLPFGAVVALANLTDCFQIEMLKIVSSDEILLGNWARGRYAWKFDHIVKITPIQVRGHQGIWNWDAPREIENLYEPAPAKASYRMLHGE